MTVLVGACQGSETSTANQANASAPKAAAPQGEGDVGTAERLVRERLGNSQGLAFASPLRAASEGVTIICGQYSQAGASHRYIVVGGEDVFIEPQMAPGEMDRAVAEFCRGGSGNRPSPVAPTENAQ